MRNNGFEAEKDWFDLKDQKIYYLQGIVPEDAALEAFLDQKKLALKILSQEDAGIFARMGDLDGGGKCRVKAALTLPGLNLSGRNLDVYAAAGRQRFHWFSISVKELSKKQKELPFFVEEMIRDASDRSCVIRGWAVDSSSVSIELRNEKNEEVPCKLRRQNRPDVVELYRGQEIERYCGFSLEAEHMEGREFRILMRSQTRQAVYSFKLDQRSVLRDKYLGYYRKGIHYLRLHGVKALTDKVWSKWKNRNNGRIDYQTWRLKVMPDEGELRRQKTEVFPFMPKISIVVPLYKTEPEYLEQLVDSVKRQTYTNWELCLSDGSGDPKILGEILAELAAADQRIRVIVSEKPLKIADNTNHALEAATGDFLAFVDHDDTLADYALYEFVKCINQNPGADMIYSDEDKISANGRLYFEPNFKPDFNIDLLRTVNYICHLLVVSRSLQKEVGVFRQEFDGAQDYDFILRCAEKAKKVCHIPMALYHWRTHENSTAEKPESKEYAFSAGQRAIEAHYARVGIDAEVFRGEYPGLYRTRYHLNPKPMISILIPNKDHVDDLKRCIDSIEEKSSYENYEYIIIENNSTEEKTFQFYEELQKNNPKVRVVFYKGKFNYSAINNFGEKYARGELLWLLNNDTAIINEDCIEELAGYCSREDVGITGARLYYEDGTIQHAGVVVGFGGIAGHCFVQQPPGSTGYCHRIICAQDYSAVTAACMMVKKSVYEAVHGFSEELEVAFNDIDFCMKVRELGKLVVYNPYAELYHYESKSRGLEDTPEKIRRFQKEIATFAEKWPDILKNGDPYYNPNLTLDSQDFSLKRL